jgi:RND family efflux transporter MFP subunit
VTKRLTFLVWLAAAACGGGRSRAPDEVPEAAPAAVAVHVVRRAAAGAIYEASGTLRAKQTASVTSKIPGHVREVRVSAGDRVKSGETLAVLEGRDLEARMAAAKAALVEAEQAEREAQAGLEAAGARGDVAESTYARYQKLEAQRAVTAQEMDEVRSRTLSARADRSMAEARLARTRSGIERARADVAASEAFWAYTRIPAPFDGRVIERQVDVGNLAAPGTPLFVLEEEGALRAEVSVDESLAGRIHAGDEAAVVLAEQERFSGRVSEVFPAVDPGSRAFQVRVDVQTGKSERLAPGRFVRVEFPLGETERMLVPESAVMRRGQLELVYVVEEGRARLRLVTLGRTREGQVEVLSGLEDGDTVVAEPGNVAIEGARIATSS